MTRDPRESSPPRPIGPGDVVACYADELGEWTAAQITDINPSWKTAGVLELAWSGPEPNSVQDLGHVSPLVLTHHAHAGRLSHLNLEWVLPRSCKLIGRLPLLRDTHSDSYSKGWRLGMQLAFQRRWDRGERGSGDLPGELKLTGATFDAAATNPPEGETWSLDVETIESLDCRTLVQSFPTLRRLDLSGKLGRLENAAHLNRLPSLKRLTITNLFGMTKADRLLPRSVPALESLALHSVPREYGIAMRSAWASEVAKGCSMEVTGLRGPDWLAENLDNPLREWDGRTQISAAKFRKSVAQFKSTRRAVIAALSDPTLVDLKARMIELGRNFGEEFNKLARRDDFIETEEREELFAALMEIPKASASLSDEARKEAAGWLAQGLDETRDW